MAAADWNSVFSPGSDLIEEIAIDVEENKSSADYNPKNDKDEDDIGENCEPFMVSLLTKRFTRRFLKGFLSGVGLYAGFKTVTALMKNPFRERYRKIVTNSTFGN